ncbi:MAG: tetratricopeptide repeat protein, partial [Myxococcota bacterium]
MKINAIILISVLFLFFSCSKSPEKLGDEAFAKQDYAMAIRYYMAALKQKPDNKKVVESLSNARINYARKFFIEAGSGGHTDVKDWEILSQHLEAEGERYKIELLETYYTIAKKYIEQGRRDEALSVLKKAVIIEPVKKIAIGKIFDILSNVPDDKIEQYTEAFVYENNTDIDICLKAASFLVGKEHFDKAIAIYDKCANITNKPLIREQINQEKESVIKRKERYKEKSGHQPG